jgi:hypothetical protein
VPPVVHEVLGSQGQQLDMETRALMDRRFGHNFSRVRIYADNKAAESAEAIGAHAYTLRHNIVFGAGQYSPRTANGLRLLAHELTHVLQQENGGASPDQELTIGSAGGQAEAEAERTAKEVTSYPVSLTRSAVPRTSVLHLSRIPSASIQRAVKFTAATPSETLNPADLLATGHQFLGNTDYVLNGTAFTSATTVAQNRAALNVPAFDSTARPSGGMECSLRSVPDNEASYAMQIPTNGPWTTATTTAAILALFPGLAPCSTVPAGQVQFSIHGVRNNNNALKQHVHTHEDHHAADFKTITNNVLVPWDKKLNDAKAAGKKMVAKDQGVCETLFYAQFVGSHQTPNEIVDTIVSQVNSTGQAFHATAAGKNVTIQNIRPDAQCKNVDADAEP